MRNGRKITVVVFDWSGTLSDDRPPVWKANMDILAQFGKPTMTMEEWLPRTTVTAAEFLQAHGIERSSNELTKRYEEALAESKRQGIVPTAYPNAKSTVTYLAEKGVTLAVLSSHPLEHLRKEAREYGIEGFLAVIAGDARDKTAGLHLLLESLMVENPRAMMYVDDTVFGVQASRGAGIVSGAICNGYHTRKRLAEEKPDFLFQNLAEIPLRWSEINSY